MIQDILSMISRDHILSALKEIDKDGIRTGRQSSTYDLEYEGKLYPPKLVLSLASKYVTGKELEPNEFEGGENTESFKVLRSHGFTIKPKMQYYTWVDAHYKIADWLSHYKDKQKDLISMLADIGVTITGDKEENDKDVELSEIDPFTFYCYIYKYGPQKRLSLLQNLCKKLGISPIPMDEKGIPSANAQSVWLFSWKKDRKNNEIQRLWNFFEKARTGSITDEIFKDVLTIFKVGKAKLTEGLFNIDPENNLPINSQTKSYLQEKFGINPQLENYTDYLRILHDVRSKTDEPYCKISYDAYAWNNSEQNTLNDNEEEYGTKKGERKYWLYAPGDNADHWDEFYAKGIMGLGWERLGDLNDYKSKEEMGRKLMEREPDKGSQRNNAVACYDFRHSINPGDYIIAKKGRTGFLGYGIVTSDYFFDDQRISYKKCRKVDWKKKGYWPAEHGILKTLTNVTDNTEQMELIRQMLENTQLLKPNFMGAKNIILYGPPGTGKTYNSIDKAVEIAAPDGFTPGEHKENKSIFDALRQQGQIEFVTFHQNYSYEDFIAGIRPDAEYEQLRFKPYKGIFYQMAKRAKENYIAAKENTALSKTFEEAFNKVIHPLEQEGIPVEVKMISGVSYSITDVTENSIYFAKAKGDSKHSLSIQTLKEAVEGVKEITSGLSAYYYPLVDVIKKLMKPATGIKSETLKNYVLIIDEINRANISRVFGELITLLEDDKRIGEPNELKITLPNGEKDFGVPPNLYVIGTMNTADKSIALIDIALRRRFEFIGYYPNYSVSGLNPDGVAVLKHINRNIYNKKKSADYLIGHAYFINNSNPELVLRNKVIPLLMEYFSGKTDIVTEIFAGSDWSVSYNEDNYSWSVNSIES